MSNLILDRPTSTRTDDLRPTTARAVPAPVGSYVDSDGLRRTPQRVGSYVGRSAAAVGSYTDRDGVRRVGSQGTYIRAER